MISSDGNFDDIAFNIQMFERTERKVLIHRNEIIETSTNMDANRSVRLDDTLSLLFTYRLVYVEQSLSSCAPSPGHVPPFELFAKSYPQFLKNWQSKTRSNAEEMGHFVRSNAILLRSPPVT